MTDGARTEVWFYQLQRRRLEQVLPNLVERVLQRGWRAVLQAATPERLAAIDDLLWTHAEDSFLPHGAAKDGDPEMQPIWLTLGGENPNDAQARFLLEGVAATPFVDQGYQRLMILFDGRDAEALAAAREQWKKLRQINAQLAYWAETDEGGWRKQA
jgi:DNA polymerase-3 subunit chi